MTKGVSVAGYGKQGYCKLCSLEDPRLQDALDKRVGLKTGDRYEYTGNKVNAWLVEKGIDLSTSRPTLYAHREHVKHPKDRLVNAVQKREIEHGTVPATVTNEEFLNTLIAIGHRRAAANPDEVTIDQALKATQIKQNAKEKGNAQAVLVNIFTSGAQEPTIIEGEVREV
jgi:hypothetical protein